MYPYLQLKRCLAASSLVLITVAVGCLDEASDGKDGSECKKSSDCDSKTCAYGYCEGSACSGGDAGADECRDGWTCYTPSSSDLGRVLGDDDSPRCVATCAACPPDMHCPVFAGTYSTAPTAASTFCARGPARAGTITGPDTVVAGSDVTFGVSFAPDHAFEIYEWTYDVVGATGGGHFANDDTASVSIQIAPGVAGDVVVAVVASDVNTPKDPNEIALQEAEATKVVHVTCSPKGGSCAFFGSCCAEGSCDYDVAGGTCM
ncbi:MAG TPA: hypothetical protein VF407_19975 [Polyangiaceae bacterium]